MLDCAPIVRSNRKLQERNLCAYPFPCSLSVCSSFPSSQVPKQRSLRTEGRNQPPTSLSRQSKAPSHASSGAASARQIWVDASRTLKAFPVIQTSFTWPQLQEVCGRRPTEELHGSQSLSVRVQFHWATLRWRQIIPTWCGWALVNPMYVTASHSVMASTNPRTAARPGSTWV